MKKHWILKVCGIVLVAALASVLFGVVIESLWNWLMPSLFHLPRLTYWQAIGLFLLSRILLGGFQHGPRQPSRWKRRMGQGWERMSPEQRERFRAGVRACRPPNPEPQS